jgi:predicted DNA-binding WGR domain protein
MGATARLLLINGSFPIRGKIRDVGQIMMDVAGELEPRMRDAGFLRDAPFESINLMIRFGEKTDLTVRYERINPRYHDLPVAIQLELEPLRFASREVVHDALLRAAIKALEDVGRKYELPALEGSKEVAQDQDPDEQEEEDASATLYKRIDGQLHYHEAWIDGDTVVEHWGRVGEKGSTKEHDLARFRSPENAVAEVLASARSKGYAPIDESDLQSVEIEYTVDGMGNSADLDKRHALEERMSELLGWTGLGDCDGGSIGSGTMEVACFVVDADIAKRVIEADLKGTTFADYSRIATESD